MANSNLPKGLGFDWESDWLDLHNNSNDYPNNLLKPKCTCGTTITLGKDDNIIFHDTSCDLKKEEK